MKNKNLACTRDHSRCNRHILFYIIFDGIGKRVRREDVDCLCCP